jgi:hypothetical protein
MNSYTFLIAYFVSNWTEISVNDVKKISETVHTKVCSQKYNNYNIAEQK